MDRRLALLPVALALVAAAFTSQQTLNKDALIFFQAGLRFAAGQVPYADFSLPQGPGAAWIAGPFFSLLPPMVAWMALSGLLNAAMAFLVGHVVWRVTALPAASQLGATLSALLFIPPFGSFYNDHLAYFLGATGFTVFFLHRQMALGGLCFALAFHCKQTVGLALIAALIVAVGWEARRVLAGTAFFLVAGWVAIGLGGGGSAYWWDAVWLPITYAQNSADKNGWRLVTNLLFPWGIAPSDLLADLPHHWGRWVLVPFQLLFWVWLFRWPARGALRTTVIFFSFSTLWGGALLGRAASHLFLGTGVVAGLARKVFPPPAVTALLAFAVLQLGQSIWSQHREGIDPLVHQMGRQLAPYRAIPGYALGEKALLAVSLAGISPRQLNVYDDMAVSVPSTYLGLIRWQTRFRERIEKNKPEWLLRDRAWNVTPALGRRLDDYLTENFVEVEAVGPLALLKRRPIPLP